MFYPFLVKFHFPFQIFNALLPLSLLIKRSPTPKLHCYHQLVPLCSNENRFIELVIWFHPISERISHDHRYKRNKVGMLVIELIRRVLEMQWSARYVMNINACVIGVVWARSLVWKRPASRLFFLTRYYSSNQLTVFSFHIKPAQTVFPTKF